MDANCMASSKPQEKDEKELREKALQVRY